jgi:hypothetical protein
MSLQTRVAAAMLKANVLMKAKYAHEPQMTNRPVA